MHTHDTVSVGLDTSPNDSHNPDRGFVSVPVLRLFEETREYVLEERLGALNRLEEQRLERPDRWATKLCSVRVDCVHHEWEDAREVWHVHGFRRVRHDVRERHERFDALSRRRPTADVVHESGVHEVEHALAVQELHGEKRETIDNRDQG